MTKEADRIREVVDQLYRATSRSVLATLIRLLGSFELSAWRRSLGARVPRQLESPPTGRNIGLGAVIGGVRVWRLPV